MEMKEVECHEKDQKLYQVRELIRNSPLAAARSNPNTPFKHKVEKENRTKPGVSTYICSKFCTYIHVHVYCTCTYRCMYYLACPSQKCIHTFIILYTCTLYIHKAAAKMLHMCCF